MDVLYALVMVAGVIGVGVGVLYVLYLFRELDKRELQFRIELETTHIEALRRTRTSK